MFSKVLSLITGITCVFLLYGCGDKNNPASAGAPTELEGTWTQTVGGVTNTFVFHGNTFSAAFGQATYTGTFSIDTSITPHHIDCRMTTVTPSGSGYEGKTSLGIYLLSGNTFEFAGNEPGNTVRPTSFTSTSETEHFIMTKV